VAGSLQRVRWCRTERVDRVGVVDAIVFYSPVVDIVDERTEPVEVDGDECTCVGEGVEVFAVEIDLGFGESAERVGLGPEPLARQHTFPRDRMGVLGAPAT